jgi:hypothetical protein
LGGDFVDREDLRDSDSGVRTKFCVACVECCGETRRGNCDLRGKRLGVKIYIAEKLVLSERIFVVENFVIRIHQLADFFGLVIELGRTS